MVFALGLKGRDENGKVFLVMECYELKKQKQKIMIHAQDNEWINSAYRDENL